MLIAENTEKEIKNEILPIAEENEPESAHLEIVENLVEDNGINETAIPEPKESDASDTTDKILHEPTAVHGESHECSAGNLPDENGVNVTVKSGYVLVPILTPYYDPSGE